MFSKNILITEKTFLKLIFLLSLLIRIAYVVRLSPHNLSLDSYDWMGIAENITAGSGLGDTWRPPGYSVFLSIIILLFGKSIILLRIINSVLGSLTCIIVFFIGKKVFS